MAGEAVSPAGGPEPAARPATERDPGEWVRATEEGDDGRARWIDDDGAPRRAPGAAAPRVPAATEQGRTDA